jgi:hypothetical protein
VAARLIRDSVPVSRAWAASGEAASSISASRSSVMSTLE